MLEPANQFGLSQHVTLHGTLKFPFRDSEFEFQFAIQSVNLEKIAMWSARRRARAVVTEFAEIVASLPCSIREFAIFTCAFRQSSICGGKIVEDPMNPRA
jgi:hypothetical protein